jgi:hypothetical protein
MRCSHIVTNAVGISLMVAYAVGRIVFLAL